MKRHVPIDHFAQVQIVIIFVKKLGHQKTSRTKYGAQISPSIVIVVIRFNHR